ncbi:uncharacterized protein BCR38DRAFT_444436 [Pseudomassariella vexata]|uniref:Uncharacterized protein n=1 Tax=Pseudomassariella vexata TaxID=1141098 RepID=A0A1Y2DLV4_9PEZI|nr:uncharacterized protein BCR38DRAFT_444436 [Pseudomassariella vexata]ORY60263.1 hypothetical protein BCR38DRAFT_444436 [Pseudomassariella vexata]
MLSMVYSGRFDIPVVNSPSNQSNKSNIMKFAAIFTAALSLLGCGSANPVPGGELAIRASTVTRRAETGITDIDGVWVPFQPGYLTGTYLLFHNSDFVTLRGTGYVRVRWEVEYWMRAGPTGDLTITPTGSFILTAGGGGFQYADNNPAPFCNSPSGTSCVNATGSDETGYTYGFLKNHWHNEYYWLDGDVTVHTNEGTGLYNVALAVVSFDDMLAEINDAYPSPNRIGHALDPKDSVCPCTG